MIEVTYSCGGCDAVETMRAEADYADAGGGMVRVGLPTIRSTAPEGWVAFDPYTHCCYCATCWSAIEQDAGTSGTRLAPSPPPNRLAEERW